MRHPTSPRAGMLAALTANRPTNAGFGYAIATVDDRRPDNVHGPERALAAAMPARRRAEFLLGRRAAHDALADAGIADGPVLIAGRRPAFPAGAVGSISHCGGVAVAIAGAAARFRSLGVDVEMSTVPIEAAHLVLAEAERSWLASRTPPSRRHHLRRAFSAKEAAYKALFPLLAEGTLTLRHIRLRPTSVGFTAWADRVPGLSLAVTVRDLGPGVLAWTTAPSCAPATEPEGEAWT